MTGDPRVTTWADGFGIWHARVTYSGPLESSGAVIIARKALRDELTPRVANLDRAVWLRPERVLELDTPNTVVYREGTPA
jgi:hypothetical protein